MEQMPQHRDGIQEQLDKAYDEGHHDNKVIDEIKVRTEGEVHISDEEMQSQLSTEEKAMVSKKETMSPELIEVISRLREKGYLDDSFEGKEVHPLIVRSFSKDEALDAYRKSGGETRIGNETEKNMPYTIPKNEVLNVMVTNFDINPETVIEMDKVGVRPLTYEEIIQYGIQNPSHQKQRTLIGLGTKCIIFGYQHAPILDNDGSGRVLDVSRIDSSYGDQYRCLVVHK